MGGRVSSLALILEAEMSKSPFGWSKFEPSALSSLKITCFGFDLSLHLSCNHHGSATDLATLSLLIFLFSDNLRARENFNPGQSLMRCYSPNPSFVGLFFPLLALFLVKLSWQTMLILIHAHRTTSISISLPWLRCHYRARCTDCVVGDVVFV